MEGDGATTQKRKTEIGLATFVNSKISVITNDGRNLVGILKGFDQFTNLILNECHERVYAVEVSGVGMHYWPYLMKAYCISMEMIVGQWSIQEGAWDRSIENAKVG